MADQIGKGEVSMKRFIEKLSASASRSNNCREVRPEALELIQAMNTGHKGCLGTLHANSPEDGIVRLEALAGSDAENQ